MYSIVRDFRNKRNTMFDPQYSIENYYTDVQQKKEMKHSFGEELLNNLHLLPDPLKKNLADSIISDEPKQKVNKNFLNMETVQNQPSRMQASVNPPDQGPAQTFSGISNFFSGVINVISSAMFQWRPRSPATYYDCFDETNVSRQGSPPFWQDARTEDQNKNERAHILISNANSDIQSDMSNDVKSAVAKCEDKLNKVRLLLTSTSKPVETPKFRRRRPRKVFVEPGSVEESFEDAFAPEDFVSLSNDSYVEYCSPFQYHKQELHQTDSPKMHTKLAPVNETTEIVTNLPAVENPNNTKFTAVNNEISNCIVVNSDPNCKTVNNAEKNTENLIENINNETKVVERLYNEKEKVNTNKPEIESTNNKDTDKTETIAIDNTKEELISSCEDKLSKLKALLQERRKNNTKTIMSTDSAAELEEKTSDMAKKPPIPVPNEKSQDKRFKNPCRRTEKRRKSKLKKHIQDDMLFAHEIHSDDLSSMENSPSMRPKHCLGKRLVDKVTSRRNKLSNCSMSPSNKSLSETPPSLANSECFDEISGRFHSASTDSDDSFQIVFNDSPKTRARIPSECDSEDSFIVFEESPNSCYTTNDVFGEESDSESEYSDSESDVSDSECIPVTKLAHSLSRTFGDLTDDSLFEDNCVDEVDCAVRSVCEEIPSEDIEDSEEVCEVKSTGLLLDDAKKLLRKGLPPKKVHFSEQPPKVHVMRVWAFAARQARAGHWERCALDRDRFKRRIADVDMAVSWVLKPQHRRRVMFQRFMPWWNAIKRKELAEKKQKQEEERLKAEAEKLLEEERLREEEKRLEEERLRVEAERKMEEERKRVEHELLLANHKTAVEAFNKIRKIKRIGRIKGLGPNIVKKDLTNGVNEIKGKKVIINDAKINNESHNDIKDKLTGTELIDYNDKVDESLSDAKINQDIEVLNNKFSDIKLEIQSETLSGT